MDPYDNPLPSHSWDDPAWDNIHIEEVIEAMDSITEPNRETINLFMPSQQYPITDSELLGILSENVNGS